MNIYSSGTICNELYSFWTSSWTIFFEDFTFSNQNEILMDIPFISNAAKGYTAYVVW